MVATVSIPGRLGLFVINPDTGKPVPGLPLFAEVAVPRITPPIPPANRALLEPIVAALNDLEPGLDWDTMEAIATVFRQALANVLTPASITMLLNDFPLAQDLATKTLGEVLAQSPNGTLAGMPSRDLLSACETILRDLAQPFDLELREILADSGILWSEPLGVLTTDHVGYVSFDLERLRPDVRQMLASAIALRLADPTANLDTEIRVLPYGSTTQYEVLSQGRIGADAVVGRLPIAANIMPPALQNMGPRSLQNPGLTDWRLSPASFAASPKSLLGENGCETMLPASVALQEFVFRQVVRLTDGFPDGGLPAGYKAAYVDDYKVSWFQLGHSLGEILYSLPLAPAETVKLAVIDWSWDSLTSRDETTKLTEDILHQTHRDRTISETVKAGLKEYQHGSSFMGGYAHSGGGSGGMDLGVADVGAAAGDAWSLGGSTASSDGSRDLTAENVQRLSDSFVQASSSQRELSSTVVIQARQEESESIQTRTFTNYNHSHTLTVLYYEVLRHFRVTTEWVRRRRAVLVDYPKRIDFKEDNLLLYRHQLEPNLLDPALAAGFAALDHRETIRLDQERFGINPAVQPPPPFWEGDVEFEMFELGLWSREDTADNVTTYVVTAGEGLREKKYELHYVYKGPDAGEYNAHNINSGERFDGGESEQWTLVKPFDQTTGRYVSIPWKNIVGFQFEKWGDDDWRITYLTINAFGSQGKFPGWVTYLTGWKTDVDLFFLGSEPSSQSFTGIKRPGAWPAPNAPLLNPTQSISSQEYNAIKRLVAHVDANEAYYNRVVSLSTSTDDIAIAFEGMPWPGGTLADHADPQPLDVFGKWVAYPLAKQATTTIDDSVIVDLATALAGNDPARKQWAVDFIAALSPADQEEVQSRLALANTKSERLVSMPTRGVFAEGKLGHCNVSEEIDDTKFWKWEEHPIPFEAPGINAVTPISPEPQAVTPTPTPFPAAMVNVVSPTPAPDPTGLAAALSLLGTPNIFRDMSGREEVADLLKKLSDNTISIAEAATKARQIRNEHGEQLDKQQKDYQLGTTNANAEVMKEALKQRREEAQQVKPAEAQQAIKLSESEVRKGNKTPEEHKEYSKQVQQNVKGATPPAKKKANLAFQINLTGYGPRRLVGRFGTTVKQKGADVGFLMATDYSDLGYLKVGVLNDHDDPRYDIVVEGEVLAGVGINAMLKGGNTVVIPQADFDKYDFFYFNAVAETATLEVTTTNSDEVVKEVTSKLGGTLEGSYKQIVTMSVEGGGEWKDGKTHTVEKAVKVNAVYYTGGFRISYNKSE